MIIKNSKLSKITYFAALTVGYGCCSTSKCGKAKSSYAALEPTIRALERYRADHHAYPNSINDLIPKYLKEIPGSLNGFPVTYHNQNGDYELHFKYSGPGMNTCTHTPRSEWNCTGYY